MMEHEVHRIERGMEVYDAAGHEIGTVAFVFRQLHLPAGGTDPETALTSEDMVEVKTTGCLGLGAYLHLHLSDIETVTDTTLFLTRSLAELKAAEQHDTPALPGEPHELPPSKGLELS